jgi:hypothetical protein
MASLETEIGHGNTGLVPWSAFSDVSEPVPELAWPTSITTYSIMRADAQIASLRLAFTLPIRRYHWFIDPNGARDEVVENVANDFNPRSRDRTRSPLLVVGTGSVMIDISSTRCSCSRTVTHSSSRCIASMTRPRGSAFASSHLVCQESRSSTVATSRQTRGPDTRHFEPASHAGWHCGARSW